MAFLLDTMIYGVRELFSGAVASALTRRSRVWFRNGFAASDDPTNERTIIDALVIGGAGSTGRAIVSVAGAGPHNVSAGDAAKVLIQLTGAATGTPDVIFPLPATEDDSYVRVIECSHTGAVRLKMSAGFSWTVPAAATGSGSLLVVIFTPSGVTALSPGGGTAFAAQFLDSSGYVGGASGFLINPYTGRVTLAMNIDFANGSGTTTTNIANGKETNTPPKSIQTTDATPTLLDFVPMLTDSRGMTLSWLVQGIKSDATKMNTYQVTASHLRGAAGAHSLSTPLVTKIREDDATWAATAVLVGASNYTELRVTGKAAETIRWTSILTQLEVIP